MWGEGESMAIRTFVPGIKLLLNLLKKYIAKHAEKLKANLGEGLYTVIQLVLDLVTIAVSLIESGENANGDFTTKLTTLNSTQINEVAGAVSKFYRANGVTGEL
jgi:hypothetical protein